MGRASRRKRDRAAKSTPPLSAVPSRPKIITRLPLFLAILGALAAALAFTLQSPWSTGSSPVVQAKPAATPLVKFESGPRNFNDLLAVEPAKLATLDLARVNLLCAEGLPGAEKLHVEQCAAELGRWADRVRFETDRHLYKFRRHPAEYESSEGYFRMLMLITVLQQDLGVHYNPARVRDIDFTRSDDLFIHGMIPAPGQTVPQTNGGTCVSMPVIYTAVARRLGYPVKLVHTKAHIFCRWEAPEHPNPAWRSRFNIEATNQGMNSFPDDYYKTWPHPISEAEIQANRHLQSLTPAEELAEFLATRGHCLLDTGRTHEALDAYTRAVRLGPSNALLTEFRHDALRKLAHPVAQSDLDIMDSSRPRPQTAYDPRVDVERINALNRANLERMLRPPAPGVPQPGVPPPPGVPQPYQPPQGVPGRPPVP